MAHCALVEMRAKVAEQNRKIAEMGRELTYHRRRAVDSAGREGDCKSPAPGSIPATASIPMTIYLPVRFEVGPNGEWTITHGLSRAPLARGPAASVGLARQTARVLWAIAAQTAWGGK